ncbi:MAG: hypothetical protein JWM86_2300 [Thermoleophilia bacterium]|nr:hypothetical protein [Thermoleophilia bacterium]
MSAPVDVPIRLASDGSEVTLRELSGGQPMLVVLTRHMDCPYCEVHVGRVQRSRNRLGRIVVVAHGDVDELREHYIDLPDEIVVVTDSTQALYDAFATRRYASAREIRVRARSLFTHGLWHVLRGRRISRPGQDLLQLGGDAVVDTDGRVAFIHRATKPDDRLDISELASRLHRAG